ncbi:hypothetical protein BCR33DRAFT_713562 [Rhizoclosmatium globosum]|uniref:Uncharacterized protein n=1 Tax=Rhizoclosmatium globosum TaxID=329046 RepID=A0A1Y2CSG3_9FUNG|nr:hypothetical protein BCR33DRAFT_713562 [Rhizoclosmatium globosum]|eukprot:ORY49968.1 hypothetical protein BCR33DRAFT_713562 [Rhizoclosmatium globosum]
MSWKAESHILLYLALSGALQVTFISDALASELDLDCHPFVDILKPAGFSALSCPDALLAYPCFPRRR